jgi:hypothetical protein
MPSEKARQEAVFCGFGFERKRRLDMKAGKNLPGRDKIADHV